MDWIQVLTGIALFFLFLMIISIVTIVMLKSKISLPPITTSHNTTISPLRTINERNVSFNSSSVIPKTYHKETYKLPLVHDYCDKNVEEMNVTPGDSRAFYPIFSPYLTVIWPNDFFEDDIGIAYDNISPKHKNRSSTFLEPFDDKEYLRLVIDIIFLVRYEPLLKGKNIKLCDLETYLKMDSLKKKIKSYFVLRLHGGKKLHELYEVLDYNLDILAPLIVNLDFLELDPPEIVEKYCDCYMIESLAKDVIVFFKAFLPPELCF